MASLDEPTAEDPTYYDTQTYLHDLGRERFDQDVAAITDRDISLYSHAPTAVAKGRAPKGLEQQVFAWNTMQYTTEDKDEKEEKKGDLHGGQLYRQNRAAREPEPVHGVAMFSGAGGMSARGGRGRGGFGGRGGSKGGRNLPQEETFLRAAMKPSHDCFPMAKGYAEELSADMFWDEPIV